MSSVTAIVVNWRQPKITLRCLRSLEKLDYPCQVIVIDNGSDDHSADYLTHHCPDVEVLRLPVNRGFGSACNHGIKYALQDTTCEYVLLLNNDVILHPQALTELVRAAQLLPNAGVLGPKVYYNDGSNRIWYAGARRRWAVLAAAETGRGQIDHGQFNQIRQVDYVFGAAMFVRRTVFEQIGLFDENFFLYLEDLDFCLRVQGAGFTLWFVPQAHVWHEGSASIAYDTTLYRYHIARSTIYFLRKHISPYYIPLAIAFWLLVAMRTIAIESLRGNVKKILWYWSGFMAGLAIPLPPHMGQAGELHTTCGGGDHTRCLSCKPG